METQSELSFYENQVKQIDVDINRNCTALSSMENTLGGQAAVVSSLYGLIKGLQMERDQNDIATVESTVLPRKPSLKQKPVPPPKPTKGQPKSIAQKAAPPPIKPKPTLPPKPTPESPTTQETVTPPRELSVSNSTEHKQNLVEATNVEPPVETISTPTADVHCTTAENEPTVMEAEPISPPETFVPIEPEVTTEMEAIPPPDAFADKTDDQLLESAPTPELNFAPYQLNDLPIDASLTKDSAPATEPLYQLRKALSVDCLAISKAESCQTVESPDTASIKPKQILEPKPSVEPVNNLKKALSVDCLSSSSGHGSLQSPPEPRPPRPRRKATSRRKLSIKPEEISPNSSLESGISYSSSITASSTQSPSPEQTRSSTRKQRASREGLNKFIEKHTKVGLTKSLPTPPMTTSKITPYPEEWTRKKQYLSIQKRHNLRDLKFDSAGNIILTTKSSVQIYDNNGVFQEKLYTNRVAEPWGLHVNHENGNILVSDCDEDCVKEFNGLGIIVQEYGPVPGPRGVAMTSAGYVFVCSETDSCVYVFDKRAQLITVIGQGVLSSPTYIALHHKTILVSDESRIIGFNVESEIEYVYGRADGSRHPACLCIDNQTGFVLATSYYKDKLIAFNQKMERAVKVKQSSRPILCAISPYGHLLIAENNSSGTLLKMFRMK